MKTAMIRARVEPNIKSKAEKIFKKLGLNPSKAINLFYFSVCNTNSIPFNLEIPNEKTLKAMEDVELNRNMTECKDAKDMFKKLGI